MRLAVRDVLITMYYNKILTVINERTSSSVTARYAISLAMACKAELVLYSAHDPGCDDKTYRNTERHQDQLFSGALELDIVTTRITEIGTTAKLLPKRVIAEKAELVFYPLTPDEHYGAALRIHAVHGLLRTIRSDLAIMRIVHMGKPHPRGILVPLGGIVADCEQRVCFVAALAKSFHSKVTLFHRPGSQTATGMPGDISRFRDGLLQRRVTVQERSGTGHVGRSIAVEAITRHNDLIVLGASERSALRRLFSGNPAGDVMHLPPCNTILFRAAH